MFFYCFLLCVCVGGRWGGEGGGGAGASSNTEDKTMNGLSWK